VVANSLALDASGNPHISYYDYKYGIIKYAKWTGSAWDISTIDSAGINYQSTSLKLDGLGNPHISYYDSINSVLKYAEVVPTPVANFTATPVSGNPPLTIQFNDTSTGSPTSWNWNFGDDSAWVNGTAQTLSHTFTGVGIYTVTLVVSNSAGQDQIQRAVTVTKAITPLPGFSDLPTDPDGDGIYEDLNGNGRLDFADVVLYFNQMEWIAANEPVSAFDLNGNERIDFADIVQLFGEI
jgi:PKD repeat protein